MTDAEERNIRRRYLLVAAAVSEVTIALPVPVRIPFFPVDDSLERRGHSRLVPKHGFIHRPRVFCVRKPIKRNTKNFFFVLKRMYR